MFTQLRIQNFKSWADTGEFRMAPLTGFFGTNSSCKTAILQFILMLKQTVESSDRNRILHLGGDQYSYVDLGTTYDISHRHRLPEKLKFSLNWIPKLIFQDSLSFIADREKNDLILHLSTSSLRFESLININSDLTSVGFFQYSFLSQDRQWNHFIIRESELKKESPIYQLFTEGSLFKNSPQNWVEGLKNYGFGSVHSDLFTRSLFNVIE